MIIGSYFFDRPLLNGIMVLLKNYYFFSGIHATIGENDLEMFVAAQFYHQAIRNSLSSAQWGVSDIKIAYESGVDENSITQTSFPSLVPGNELVVAGRFKGDGESMVKIVLTYKALGIMSEQKSFTKESLSEH